MSGGPGARRDLPALVLLLAGGTLVKLAVTGDYLRYVRAGTRPYLLAAGIVMVAVAALSLPGWTAHTSTDPSGPGPGGHRDRPGVAWLFVVPTLVLLLIAPPALGSYSASRSGTVLAAATDSRLPPLPSGDPVRLSILEYASRAVFADGRSLTGRRITLSGFLLAQPRGWYLTRMVISCCAADARPVKVGLIGAVPAGLRSDEWLEVTGGYIAKTDHDAVNGAAIPYLDVAAAHPVAAPRNRYDS